MEQYSVHTTPQPEAAPAATSAQAEADDLLTFYDPILYALSTEASRAAWTAADSQHDAPTPRAADARTRLRRLRRRPRFVSVGGLRSLSRRSHLDQQHDAWSGRHTRPG